ncbi:hypothetical protein [Bacillus cereus]|uniref:hypothetical protein n=1 Tax=Bacillus cereus TaxID=1396 RepID=UPI0020D2848C|nr:hypothetical protein [Bacillus cereus]
MNIIVTPELLEASANKFKSAQEQAQVQFTNLRQDSFDITYLTKNLFENEIAKLIKD